MKLEAWVVCCTIGSREVTGERKPVIINNNNSNNNDNNNSQTSLYLYVVKSSYP
jgi:hypothetical protein